MMMMIFLLLLLLRWTQPLLPFPTDTATDVVLMDLVARAAIAMENVHPWGGPMSSWKEEQD